MNTLIKFSTQKPIWKDGVSVPTKDYLNTIFADFEKYQVAFKINYMDDETIQLVIPNVLNFSFNNNNYVFTYAEIRTVKYEEKLKYQNMLNWDNNFYYTVSKIEKFSNNAKLITFKLDYTLSFTVPFLEKIKNEPMYMLRNPILDSPALNFNDPLMNDLKYSGNYNFSKFTFTSKTEGGKFYWEYKKNRISYSTGTSQSEVVNGVMYAVFNGGDNGKYLYIPVLAKTQNLYYESRIGVTEPKRLQAWVKTRNERERTDYYLLNDIYDYKDLNTDSPITREDFKYRVETYLQGGYRVTIEAGDTKDILASNRTITNKNDIFNIWYRRDTETLPNSRFRHTRKITTPFGTSASSSWYSGRVGSGFNPREDVKNMTYVNITFTSTGESWNTYTIENNYNVIEKMKNSTEYSNKYLGNLFLPHVLFLQEYATIKNISFNSNSSYYNPKLLVLDFQPEGNIVYERTLINDNYEDDVKPTLSVNIDNWYLTKYLRYKYYNNDVDMSLFYNDTTQSFKTQGYFNFTGSGNYIDKVDQLPIIDCVWTYPHQLPSSTDTYTKYVSGVYNTTNTGVAVAKQQFALSALSGIAGTIFGGIANAGNIAGMVQNGVNGAFGLLNTSMNYYNQMKMLNAQFADAKNRMGNTISNSLATDTCWINYYLKDNEQYSGLERFYGDDSFNKQLNSIIYYYSYYSPQYLTLEQCYSKFTGTEAWDNIYIQIDEKWLSTRLYSLLINKLNNIVLSEKIFNWIYNQLLNGIRIYADINKIPK